MHSNEPETRIPIDRRPTPTEARESVSKVFAETRKSFDQDLRTVADALRIRYDYLLAIEEGRFQDLPGSTYAVGFVRTYAEYLNLDIEEIVNRFKEEISGFNSRTELVFPKPKSEVRVPGMAIVFFSALLIGVAYGTWFFLSADPEQNADRIPDAPAGYPDEPAVGEYTDLEAEQPPTPAISADEDSPLQTGADESAAATAPPSRESAQAASQETKPEPGETPSAAGQDAADVRAVRGAQSGRLRPVSPVAEADQNESGSIPAKPVAARKPPDPPQVPRATSPGSQSAQRTEERGGGTAVRDTSPAQRDAEAAVDGGAAAPAREGPAADTGQSTDAGPSGGRGQRQGNELPPQVASTAPVEAEIPEAPALTMPRTIPQRKSPPPATRPSVEAAPLQPPLPPATPPRLEPARPGEVQVGVRAQGEAPTVYGAENRDARIVLRAIFDSYVLVRDEKDGLLMTKVLRSGDEYRVPNRDGLSMLTGNAGGLRIEVDGRRVPSVGPVGAIVRNVALDPDRLRSGTAVTR